VCPVPVYFMANKTIWRAQTSAVTLALTLHDPAVTLALTLHDPAVTLALTLHDPAQLGSIWVFAHSYFCGWGSVWFFAKRGFWFGL